MKSVLPALVAALVVCLQTLGVGALIAPPPAAHAATAAEVASLREKLGGIAAALAGMLKPKPGHPGSLANSAVAPEMRAFLAEMNSALAETATAKDPTTAMRKLMAVHAGLANLTESLTAQQTSLMRRGDEDQSSLLLGVLMTSRGKPMEQQLEVLRSPDFKSLPVSEFLMAHHDADKPLFQQAAAFMDAHGAKNGTLPDERAAQLAKAIEYFSSRVETLKKEEARAKAAHDVSIASIDELIKKADKDGVKRLEVLKRHQERDFKKEMLKHNEQTKILEDALVALKHGDMNALAKARDAMKQSVERLRQRAGDFLHLIQLGHRLQNRDCPYCAAQCIDKCHTAGNPYAQCLADCADAGK